MDEIFDNSYLDEEIKKYEDPETSTDKIVNQSKLEFNMGGTEKQLSIKNERDDILTQIKTLEKKMRKYKNVKNTKMTQVNKKMCEMRKKIKMEIDILKIRLDEIEIEHKS
jgi:hypothetical protein